MESIFLTVMVAIGIYVLGIALIPRRFLSTEGDYTGQVLIRLSENKKFSDDEEHTSGGMIVPDIGTQHSSPLVRAFFLFPGTGNLYITFQKAGLTHRLNEFMLVLLVVFALVFSQTIKLGLIAFVLAPLATFLVGRWYVKRSLFKHQNAILDKFPDALDTIVRSVRSGYPLNSALQMVAENLDPPISVEFRRIVDEVSYGITLPDALKRLSERLDIADVHFFTVVLNVQQESGGNLSEVLNNLSSILRKRKHLRLKIRAMSSEGRATAWILGLLPFIVALAINFIAPHHLVPLYTTQSGYFVLGLAISMLFGGLLIIRKITNIDI